jgi:hypothetical protein
MNQPSFATGQMQILRSRMVWLYFFFFNLFVAGILMIWTAEQMAGRESRPFSDWYFGVVAYAAFGLVYREFFRHRLLHSSPYSNQSENFVKRWYAIQLIGICAAFTPLVCGCGARIILKMSIWYSVPWYVLTYVLLFLWRPKLPAFAPAEKNHTVADPETR